MTPEIQPGVRFPKLILRINKTLSYISWQAEEAVAIDGVNGAIGAA